MKAKAALAALFITATFVAPLSSGCGDETTVVVPAAEESGITVTGTGEVRAEPDVARVSVGVEVQRPTVEEAREAAAAAAEAMLRAARERGVASSDLRTSLLSITPVYEYPSDQRPRVVGYTVSNMVEVTIRDLGRASEVFDALVAAGGDATRVHGIVFELDDREEVLHRAREAAMADAKRKAEQLASLAGVRLGAPLTIAETVSAPPVFVEARDVALPKAGVSTPIEPGTTSVIVQVTVRWMLEE